jgi:hypothetical protein
MKSVTVLCLLERGPANSRTRVSDHPFRAEYALNLHSEVFLQIVPIFSEIILLNYIPHFTNVNFVIRYIVFIHVFQMVRLS